VGFYRHWKIATGKLLKFVLVAEIESIACLLRYATLFGID
jgi:hypothetical protein